MKLTEPFFNFSHRHIGIHQENLGAMLQQIGVNSIDQLIGQTIPDSIRRKKELESPEAMSEQEYLEFLKGLAAKNKVFKNYIGLGYSGTNTPSVILRNIFQNPGWYTQYTPYQAEIAQGRLEALLNFQTVVSDLTGLPIANASLLDEATAASEAMAMFHSLSNKKGKENKNEFFISDKVLPQTIDVCITRATPLGIKIVTGDWKTYEFHAGTFGVLLQYPNVDGAVEDYSDYAKKCNTSEVYLSVAADLLSLALLTPPGEWGADCVIGNSQRFGVPMGYGGPHAAFFATREDFKRLIPGRLIGVSVDSQNNVALRMALQTREQHIKREKATSNICTAQALLSIMAGMYAAYHGPNGIKAIAQRTHELAKILDKNLQHEGITQANKFYFDTLKINLPKTEIDAIRHRALFSEINLGYAEDHIRIALDETTSLNDLEDILALFGDFNGVLDMNFDSAKIPGQLQRKSEYLTHPVFNQYHTESKMMRYIKRLENKDLSLVHSMIPLGSCTMKLNAASELLPVSWPEFANIHPFAPLEQTLGYQQVFRELGAYLCEITDFEACSLQPNSGAQGEYAGLLVIKAYHEDHGQHQRNIALIPSSAHGTNPASAVMCGMEVVVVACDERGNIDLADLNAKAEQYKDTLSCLMATYPSTHGVFETAIQEICQKIHDCGGLVYMDGANMNAQVGLTSPGAIGADVNHINLHKTFAIPHGGGGPGMGPICVNKKLAPYLPGHVMVKTGGELATHAVSAAPWGSASILLISYGYCKMLGHTGLRKATEYAILNANYIKARLEGAYEILYTGEQGRCAHEMIVDLRNFKPHISAEDVAKRLIDYGFHAPTVSFPVAGTLMIEPTESESKDELDRFCDALLEIRKEIDEIIQGKYEAENNVLHNAPHTMALLTADQWNFPYSREKAAYPLPYLTEGYKFWPAVGRVNNAHGDRNLICVCPPIEDYMTTHQN